MSASSDATVRRAERKLVLGVLPFRPSTVADEDIITGEMPMKTTTILAVALGLGSLAACNKSPTEQAAENVESTYGNAAENVQATTSNAAESIESNASNASADVKAAGKNEASAIKNEGKAKANEIRNGAATTNNAQ